MRSESAAGGRALAVDLAVDDLEQPVGDGSGPIGLLALDGVVQESLTRMTIAEAAKIDIRIPSSPRIEAGSSLSGIAPAADAASDRPVGRVGRAVHVEDRLHRLVAIARDDLARPEQASEERGQERRQDRLEPERLARLFREVGLIDQRGDVREGGEQQELQEGQGSPGSRRR
jgi:hypothetical protein